MRRAPFLAVLLLSACHGGAPGGGVSSSATTGTGGHDAGPAPEGGQGGATGACAACAGACVDTASDPRHCGACGHTCPSHTLCDRGACAVPLCLVAGPLCPNDHVCCGDACCPPWEMCCNAPDAAAPICVSLDAGACPTDCAGCL